MMDKARLLRVGLAATFVLFCVSAAGAEYSWQKPHATVLPTGDLEWAPQPFVFEAGETVRYVDFEGGDDSASGASQDAAWKHHPWDPEARGNAAKASGPITYVFRRGVAYRGALRPDESGEPGNPIRLTSDPAWGEGEAAIYGSELVTGWTRGADLPEIPEGESVWYADLDFAPRCVWMVDDEGDITRIKLARTPNWQVSDPYEILSEWWEWENPRWWTDEHTTTVDGKKMHLGIDTEHLTREADYYEGGLVWSEFGIMMGSPFASEIQAYDPEQKAVAFQGIWYGDTGEIITGCRYYLEDKPHYLDEPGEFWFDKEGVGGRLYVRLPGDVDPNSVAVEAGKRLNIIDSDGVSHLSISGLTFRFTNVYWDLAARGFVDPDVDCAVIRIIGSGRDIEISNCTFEHVQQPVRIKVGSDTGHIEDARITDNRISHTDHGAISLSDSSRWGKKEPPIGTLGKVAVLRNKLDHIGFRPIRSEHGTAIGVGRAKAAELAGNIVERCAAQGINVTGGKGSGARWDAPFTRFVIHHNKVVDTLLRSNDWGGIETWQGGPFYVYSNISGNPGGYMNWRYNPEKPGSARFGHAYYMDGCFKNYQFNNLAWGRNNDPASKYCNTSAFQEIISFQNTVFNNSIHRFFKGSRRQAPQAGRDKFLGNIWQDISGWVFWHAKPTEAEADPNVYQISEKEGEYAYETNAYARNVFHGVTGKLGVFESTGVPRPELEQMRGALEARDAMAAGVGVIAEQPPLPGAAEHDFRPAPGSAAIDRGVRVFVPWSLYAMVGEWNFTRNNADPTTVIDEHWYMTPYFVGREEYYTRPTYPFRAVNVEADDYVSGPLEDWTDGALRLNGEDQYLVLEDAELDEPFRLEAEVKQTEGGWATVKAPAAAVPGEPFDLSVTLAKPVAGQQVAVHLHWFKGNAFGGFNAWGGLPKDAGSVGPHTFTFTPEDKPGLERFSALVFLSPSGEFGDRTREARVEIARAEPGADVSTRTVTLGGEEDESTQWVSIMGEDLKSAEVYRSNFLIEVYFRTEPGAEGTLARKMGDAGYALSVGEGGAATFTVKHAKGRAQLDGDAPVNDGDWHHLIAEADREAGTLTLYVDGQREVSGDGVGPVPLANDADLYAAGTPEGDNLACTLEFLRIAHGTLADARTSIEELYAWQFDGPQFRDFAGNKPAGAGRDAGALELTR
ncbi:MAG: LamG-like jellyroll fold domain-containing protein [Candidatus Brocadiia bacterium]